MEFHVDIAQANKYTGKNWTDLLSLAQRGHSLSSSSRQLWWKECWQRKCTAGRVRPRLHWLHFITWKIFALDEEKRLMEGNTMFLYSCPALLYMHYQWHGQSAPCMATQYSAHSLMCNTQCLMVSYNTTGNETSRKNTTTTYHDYDLKLAD